jgi:hypothetical protein
VIFAIFCLKMTFAFFPVLVPGKRRKVICTEGHKDSLFARNGLRLEPHLDQRSEPEFEFQILLPCTRSKIFLEFLPDTRPKHIQSLGLAFLAILGCGQGHSSNKAFAGLSPGLLELYSFRICPRTPSQKEGCLHSLPSFANLPSGNEFRQMASSRIIGKPDWP